MNLQCLFSRDNNGARGTPALIYISYADVLCQYAHVSAVELPFR